MPYHKVPRARLHEDIRAIEREGEVVTEVGYPPDDPEHVDVFTCWRGSPIMELRA